MRIDNFDFLDRIGIFCLPVARPEDTLEARHILNETIEDIRFAESEGFGFAWVAEHHGIDYGGCVPDPLTFIAAAGQKTSRIALGSCMTLAPLRHPRLIAQQAQMTSRLIRAPLHLGLGKGFLPSDVQDFGLTHPVANMKFWDAVETLAALRSDPQWVQDIWVASTSIEGAETAGRLGLGLALNPYTRTDEEINASIGAYGRQIEKFSNTNAYRVLIHEPIYLRESADLAAKAGSSHFQVYLDSLKAGQGSPSGTTDHRHTLGQVDYASRCGFQDIPSFSERLLAWRGRGATHWCFLVRFGNMEESEVRATLSGCAEAASLADSRNRLRPTGWDWRTKGIRFRAPF